MAIGGFYRLDLVSGNFRGNDASSSWQFHFQEWLNLVLDRQLHFRQRSSLVGNEGRNHGPFGYRREDATVRKSSPLQCQFRIFGGLTMITECRLQGRACERTQIRI